MIRSLVHVVIPRFFESLVLILCLCGFTWKETTQVYSQLIRANNLYKPPSLYRVEDLYGNRFNAASDLANYRIIITNELIKKLNKEEIAYTLAHELGHFYLTHKVSTFANEYEADRLSIIYTKKAGYDGCKGIKWLHKSKGDDGHPSFKLRFKQACPPSF